MISPSIITKMARIARASRAVLLWAAFVLPILCFQPGNAQQTPDGSDVSTDQIQRILEGRSTSSPGTSNDQLNRAPEIILQPSATPNTNLPVSRLEEVMSRRTGVKLRQFGYDQLGMGHAVSIPQMGAVQDDYVLGPGDEVIVSLRGQENSEYRTTVDRNGQLVLPRLNPISAAGRTFGDFRQDLQRAVSHAYVSTQVFVSVSRLRQISVLVTGEVTNPGARIMTGLSTPADAIAISGGVKKTGSLRAVRVFRGGRVLGVDLYDLITQRGGGQTIHLADGDRIVVPPLGRTAAVTGWVRLPGIYELAPGASAISVRGLTLLAGGYEVRGKYNLSVLRLQRDGQSQMTSVSDGESVRDGEILFVQPAAAQTVSQATLSGGTVLAGRYAVRNGSRLSSLIKSPGALGPSPYTLFGIIVRRDPVTYLRTLTAFTPAAVLDGSEDLVLQSDDVVRVFSISEAQMIQSAMEKFQAHVRAVDEAVRNPQAGTMSPLTESEFLNRQGREPGDSPVNATAPVIQGPLKNGASPSSSAAALAVAQGLTQTSSDQRQEIARLSDQTAVGGAPSDRISSDRGVEASQPENLQEQSLAGMQEPTNTEVKNFGELARQLSFDPRILAHFLLDHAATISGAVRGEGLYIIGPHVNLPELLAAAGGTNSRADQSSVELISSDVDVNTGVAVNHRYMLPLNKGPLVDYIVKPGDEIRFNQTYTDEDAGTVTIQGELRFTGSYQIGRGEHLSSILLRAGGLTQAAFPYGTVFLRRSAAALEADGYKRAADEIESELVAGMTRISSGPTSNLSPETFAALQNFITEIRAQKPLGRISVVADPSVLLAKPELDPMLEPGDVIYVPQRPSTVAVLGQVLQPGSFQYHAGYSFQDYLDRAGGYAQFADKSATFVVLPDGSAKKVDSSWLNFNDQTIPPGSAVVVSRDLAPYDFRQFVLDSTQILSQLAISAASLAVLSQNK